jgi:hypothetical protein
MSYQLSKAALPNLQSRLPVPIGELLEQLAAEGFQIDLLTYQQTLAALSVSFPYGLGIGTLPDGKASIDADDKLRLKQVLSPIIATSPEEQTLFSDFFQRFEQWPLLNAEVAIPPRIIVGGWNPSINVVFQLKLRRSHLFHRYNYILWTIILAAFIVFDIYLIHHLPTTEIIVHQEIGTQPHERRYTYDDEHFFPTDSLEWRFSETTQSFKTVPTNRISHTFPDTGAYFIRIKRTGSIKFPLNIFLFKSHYTAIDSTFTLIQDDKNISADSTYHPPLKTMATMPEHYQVFTLDRLESLLLFAGLIIAAISIFFFLKKRVAKLKLNEGPPLLLLLPDQERYILPNNYLYTWAQRLSQREESQRFIIDIGQSIRRSIEAAGMPNIIYQPILQKSCYLFLVDVTHAGNQQIRLCRYFIRFLQSQEVELDIFYFNYSPRVCWNEKYPRGILLDDIHTRFKDQRLVLFSYVENLVNHTSLTVHPWLQPLTNWPYRAIFTYNNLVNWTAVEKALAGYFYLLPITPEGQLKMAEYFQTTALPSFELLQEFLSRNDREPFQKLFSTDPEKLTPEIIRTFLTKDKEDTLHKCLYQWACATLIYPDNAWEVTLAIGKQFDIQYLPREILTSGNLILLTDLPWLQGRTMLAGMREKMLRELTPEYSRVAIGALRDLLNDPILVKLPVDSVAYEERKIRLAELSVHSGSSRKKKEGLRILVPYLDSGLIKDPFIIKHIRRHIRTRKTMRAAYFTASLAALSLMVWLFLDKLPQPRKMLYRQEATDSAAYYNNMACAIFGRDIHFSIPSTYTRMLSALQKSRSLKSTATARYNYLTSLFDRGVSLNNRYHNTFRDSMFSPLERVAFDSLLSPIAAVTGDPHYVPDIETLTTYLKMIAKDPNANQIRDLLLKGSKTPHPSSFTPPRLVDRFRNTTLLEPFFYASQSGAAQSDSLLNMYGQLALLYEGGPKALDVGPGGGRDPNLMRLKNLRAVRTISEMISSQLLLGSSYEDVAVYEFGKGVNLTDYNTFHAAVECTGLQEPIRYFFRYFKDAQDSVNYLRRLDSLFYTSQNYVIYFFQYRRLIRQEVRLILDPAQYLRLLRLLRIDGTMLTADNNFYAENDTWYAAITRPTSFDYTKIIIGEKKSAKLCTNDWWNKNPPPKH